MTDGASGNSVDDLDECYRCKRLAFWIVIGAMFALSFLAGLTAAKMSSGCQDCPGPVYHLHKHEVGK